MKSSLPSRSDILKFLATDPRAFHAKEIATKLNVPEGSYDALLRLLDAMAFDGAVVGRDGHRFKLAGGGRHASANRDEREGTLTVNPRGFGFVASIGASGDDVYVAKELLGGAMHGDTVVVQVRARGSRGVEGEIVKITMRGTTRISGILRRRGKSAWLEPDDARIRGPVVLTQEIDLHGGEGNSGKDGDCAIVTITKFPMFPEENPEGRIDAILGTPGELSVEIQKTLLLAQVDEVHSPEAFAEAEAYGTTVPLEMLEGREDLTRLPLPTIDPEDARDHDDAVWVERTDSGGYRAWIAIADVSSYVRPGTKLDDESKKRGCSVYLPDRAIPMLPRPLSSNLCSLLPDVIRLCLCAEVTLDASGEILSRRLIRGFMKSQAKLTYGGVARALGFTELPPVDPKAEALIDGLRVANELSRLLRAKRLKRGALDFDLPEAKVVLDDKGQPTDVQRRSSDPGMKKGYQLIEELMLLANEVVAGWLVEKQLPAIFRIHEAPDEKKLDRLATLCESLGVAFDLEDAKEPKRLSALLKTFANHPLANVLNMLLLRAMKQAAYDVKNLGHFGLASTAYLHFTSPIRRYPDLVVHRIVHAVSLGEHVAKSAESVGKLEEAALAASAAERRAMEVEREIVDLYRAILMRDKIGEHFEGTVTALVGSGVFVALDSPFVDVLVKLEDLGGERYELDEEKLKVFAPQSGDSIALGDRMELEISDVGILRRSVYGRRLGATAAAAESGYDPKRLKKPSGAGVRQVDRPGKPGERGGKRGAEKGRGGGPSSFAGKGKPKGKPGGGKPSTDRAATPSRGKPGKSRPGKAGKKKGRR